MRGDKSIRGSGTISSSFKSLGAPILELNVPFLKIHGLRQTKSMSRMLPPIMDRVTIFASVCLEIQLRTKNYPPEAKIEGIF